MSKPTRNNLKDNPERATSARSSCPGDDSSDDEFFEALEDQEDSEDSCGDEEGTLGTEGSNTRREGALKRCRDLRLLVSGEPLYIPVTQVGDESLIMIINKKYNYFEVKSNLEDCLY